MTWPLITIVALLISWFSPVALAYKKCVFVDSRQHSWTQAQFEKAVSRVTSISGTWTAYNGRWGYTGPEGNSDRFCDTDDCSFRGQEYLKLYLKTVDGSAEALTTPRKIQASSQVALLGNDYPEGRGVNYGQLEVCFTDGADDNSSSGSAGVDLEINRVLKDIEDIEGINLPPLDELDLNNLPHRLENYPEIVEKIREYKEAISEADALKSKLEKLKGDLNEGIATISDLVNDLDHDLSLVDLEESFDEQLDWEPADLNKDFDSEYNYYTEKAEETIQMLDSLLQLRDRRGFLATAYQWRLNQQQVLPLLEDRASANPKEWDAYIQSFYQVENYIKGFITDTGWFKDSPIPESSRELIGAVGQYGGSSGKEIELEIKGWEKLNEQQKRLIQGVLLLGAAFKAALNDTIDYGMELQRLTNQFAYAIREESICMAKSVVAGDAGDFYEFASGRDQCTGKELTNTGRVLSGLGFFIGSARMWRKIADLIGFDVVAKKVARSIGDVTKSAATPGTALVTRNLMTKHAIERLAERGITKAMVDKTIERGTRYLDKKNGTFSFVRDKGFASGKTMQVATDVGVTKVVTVNRINRFNPNTKMPDGTPRWIKMKDGLD